MPIVPILIILLPAAEIVLLFDWAGHSPWRAVFYVIATMMLGFVFIRAAKVGFSDILRRLSTGAMPAAGLLAVGKLWLIGVLLFFPGYLTDIMAVLLLVFSAVRRRPPDSSDTPLETEARIIDDEQS